MASSRSCISQNSALLGGGLGRLGGELGARVDVVERQVAPDVAQVARVGEQLADRRLGLAAERALEVAVLEQRDRRLGRAADVVALGVDRGRRGRSSTSAVPSSARIRSGAGSRAVARKTSQVSAEATSAALRTPSFASSSVSPWKARLAIRSETVNPIPAMVPPPATAAQPTGGRSRPRLSFVTSRQAPLIPIGFPTHVAEEDAERHRRGVGARRGSRR